MKFNITIPPKLKIEYDKELSLYKTALSNNNLPKAWDHLERSHILGQSYPWEHSYTHYLMLKYGMHTRDPKEIFGQVIRLIVGGWKSFINKVPIGNIGGANVPPLKTIPIPHDLKIKLESYQK